jgi:uncharacterized membrane protein
MIATLQLSEKLALEGVTASWLWLWIVLVIAGACLLYFTYAGIFQRSERRLTWVLMLLRAAGLVALLLALAKPTWTSASKQIDPGRIGVVLDNSLSMSLAAPNGKSRYTLAREAVERLHIALENNPAESRLVLDISDINGEPIKREEIPDQPTIERTDLCTAVNATINRLRSKPLAGVVVISDGMDNTGQPGFRDFTTNQVPIFGVGFRPDTSAAGLDLALTKVTAPERVLVNNEVQAQVTVAKTGGIATKATVTIKLGTETIATQKTSFDANQNEQTIAVSFTPTKPGNFVFTATVEAEAGERFLANNSRHFPLQVDKERIRVLYIEGFLRYEYKFLKNRLQEDPDILLTPLVRPLRPEKTDSNPGKELFTADRLKKFDVVILGDLEGSYLSESEYRALVQWLDDKGHALLILGGYRSFGSEGFRATPLADVLPVVFADKPPHQSEDPFVIELSEEGKRHPIFEISKDRKLNAETWNNSPPLLGAAVVQRAKPGAEVLAVNPSLLVDGKPAVVVAVQRFGAGHTMVLTADTTWRWSRLTRVLGQSDTLYARFWSQTMRWLSGRAIDDQRPLLTVATDRTSYDVGKKVGIRVVRQPRPDTNFANTDIRVDVTTPSGKTLALEAKAHSADPDVFTADYFPTTGGRFGLSAALTKEGEAIAKQTSEFLVNSSDLELADTGTNPDNLRAMARATGGIYVDVEDLDQLATKIPRKQREQPRTQRSEFWDSPGLFFFFLAAVSAEWLIRRRNHLV